MFFSQYFSFPCQYHSTRAPYSFIHLPPTLYNIFLTVLQFSCQYNPTNATYSFIHLPPTLYNIFLPVFQFSPVSTIPPMPHTHSFIYHRRCIILAIDNSINRTLLSIFLLFALSVVVSDSILYVHLYSSFSSSQ
jgi:hypothetical protein